jgi:putative ATP-grasp target RiPP
MIVELLTPFVLATAPASVALPEGTRYDHETQMTVFMDEAEGTSLRIRTTTFNGTRTYDAQGRPYDNDQDSDESN